MAWIYLIIAALFEIVWAVCMKQSQGFTKLWPSLGTGFFMLISVGLLALAMKQLPVGTAYAVWTGIGAAGTAIVGMCFLGDSREVIRILCVGLILAGVVGLKFFTKADA